MFQYESRVRRADGQYLWFLHRNVPQWDDQGNIVMWYGSSIEIDDRKRAEEELKKAFDEIKTLKDQLHKENLALKEEIDQTSMFEEIVGASDAIKRVLTVLCKVAPTDSTVLITGETGTGKELAARAIFIQENCPAVSNFKSPQAPLGSACEGSLFMAEKFGSNERRGNGSTEMRATETYVKQDGSWLLVARQWGPLPVNFCKPVAVDTSVYRDFVGQYQWRPLDDVETVSVKDGRLWTDFAENIDEEYFPLGSETFFVKD